MVNEAEKVVYRDDDQIIGNVREDVENSLRRLQTDFIDLYQLHQGAYDVERAPELMEILEGLVTEGKIRWYGWSTDLVDRAEVFAGGEHCTSIQFQLNALFDNPEMRALCEGHDLAGINKDPLNRGILTGKFTPDSTFPMDDNRSEMDFHGESIIKRLEVVEALREPMTSGGRTMAQGALATIWALDERMIPIPGFKSVQQAVENAGAMSFGPLTKDELAQVQSIVTEYVN